MRSRAALVMLATLIASLPLGVTRAGSGACYKFSDRDRLLARKTNRARINNDLPKLQLDPQLSLVAKRHTKTMVKNDELFHTTSLGEKVTKWKVLGENVGVAGSVKKLHKLFMGSAPHKANILNGAFKYVGVKVIKDGKQVWATVIFESSKNPGTTLKMPSC